MTDLIIDFDGLRPLPYGVPERDFLSQALEDIKAVLGEGCGIHTLQLLSASSLNNVSFDFLYASRDIERYCTMLSGYLSGDTGTSSKSKPTLAFKKYNQGFYWSAAWTPSNKKKANRSKLEANEFDFFIDGPTSLDQDSRLVTEIDDTDTDLQSWKESLEGHFKETGGTTIWATLSHQSAGRDNSMNSAIYLLLDREIKSAKTKDKIAYVCREILSNYVILWHRLKISEAQDKYNADLETYYKSKGQEDPILSEKFCNWLFDKVGQAIKGKSPIIIEGRKGTGKLTVARHIADGTDNVRFEGFYKPNGIVVNGFKLTCLQDLLSELEVTDIRESKYSTIIFDDIHLATLNVQRQISVYLSAEFWNLRQRPHFIITVGPSLEMAGKDGKVIGDFEASAETSIITLPSVNELLGQAVDPHKGDIDVIKGIVQTYWNNATKIFLTLNKDICLASDVDRHIHTLATEMVSGPINGNFREVKARTLSKFNEVYNL